MLGRATNAYSALRPQQNQVIAVDSLDMVSFIHRQDITIWGGASSASGFFRADVSTDGGATFSNDLGPFNTSTLELGRYPQAVLHNPQNSLNPNDQWLVYSGPSNSASSWSGHLNGVGRFNGTSFTNITSNVSYPSNSYLPSGLCQRVGGEFWQAEQLFDGTNILDTIRLHKGVWNGTTQDVDWTIATDIVPSWSTSFDGSIHSVGSNMAFSPDGQTGWVGMLGDLTGGTDSTINPIFIRSTDGGQTWGSPMEVDLNQIAWIGDSLQQLWVQFDSVSQSLVPVSNGRASCAFDYDITVDANGNPHLVVVVGSGATRDNPDPGYSLYSGLSKYLIDVTTVNGGATWTANLICPILTFRGSFGGANFVTMDNHPQISRTADGSHIFYSWVDSDTAANTFNMNGIGFGVSDNLAPNLRISGMRVADGARTCYKLITDLDLVWEGRALFPTMAPEVLEDQGTFQLPIVITEMIANDPLSPCAFWYFGNDATLDAIDFTNANLNVAWGLGCFGQGGGQVGLVGSLRGIVWADSNANGIQDGGEYVLPGLRVRATPGPYYAYTNQAGAYSIAVPYDSFTVSFDPVQNVFNQTFPTNPNTYTAVVDTSTLIVNGMDFGTTLIPNIRDLAVTVTYGLHRPGINSTHTVRVHNMGTTVESDTVGYRYDPLLLFQSTTVPPVYNMGDSIAWAVDSLLPFQTMSFPMDFGMPTNAQIGDTIDGYASVGADLDNYEPDNTFEFHDPVVNSYDPNDKTAFPVGPFQNEIITDSTWLYYRIRFQNTGNAPAIDIRIEDTLSYNLDFNTFTMLNASHPYAVSSYPFQGTTALAWFFDGINLPDSFSNEPASHGYINFRIKPYANTPLGTDIENTAFIYFDFNPPVVTNTTLNRVDVFTGLPEHFANFELTVYPNPFHGKTVFEFENYQNEIYDFRLFDVSGKLLRTERNLQGARYVMDQGDLAPGMYFYGIYREGRLAAHGKLVAQ